MKELLKSVLTWLAVCVILGGAGAACYRQGRIDERRRLVEMLDGLRMTPWDEIAPKEKP